MKDKRILILGIFILMALAMGITYAYFSAKIIGSETESTLVFDAGTLSINLDGGNTLNGDKMIPGDTPFSTKKFTVIGNNNSNGYMPYSVNLVVDENTYSIDAISYTLELVTDETDNNGEPIENRENTPINYTDIIGSGYFTKGSNIKHTYLLKMYFLDTHTDQSADMKARFNAHIEITGNRASKNKITVTFDADGGEVETLSKEVVIGSAYGDLPIPTKKGYEFLGWNGKNLLNLEVEESFPSNLSVSNTTARTFIQGTYIKGMATNNYYIPSYVKSLVIRPNFIEVFSTNGYGVGYAFSVDKLKEYTLSFNANSKNINWALNSAIFYQCDGTLISYSQETLKHYYIKHITIPDNSCYLLLTFASATAESNSIFRNIQLEEGTEATEYEPYFIDKYTKVVQYENHTLKAIWKEI